MSQVTPFLQNGNTVKITAAVTPPTAVLVPPTFVAAAAPYNQYRVFNSSAATVFLGTASTAAQAATNAAVVSTTGAGVPLAAGSVSIFSVPSGWYFSAGVASSTADIYITPGEGL